ncbi:hypothetical protein C8P66_12150 [Humitalea rosea]|uniref:Uncharacterized protein n=1 Tax=Humitalea rosea TaxID=990373 RepID=A0A2W7IRS7_9PROT|nr:hypothetical protein [Humitalea rosea]PZW41343.1 hypothetical protein C8P66_12150 [Humitalea rosea]
MTRDPPPRPAPEPVTRWRVLPPRTKRPRLPPELIPRPPLWRRLGRRIGREVLGILLPMLAALALLWITGFRP